MSAAGLMLFSLSGSLVTERQTHPAETLAEFRFSNESEVLIKGRSFKHVSVWRHMSKNPVE